MYFYRDTSNSDMLQPRYRLFIFLPIFTILLGAFFFTSKILLADDRKVMDTAYDEILKLGNTWEVKITDAIYDEEANTLSFSFYSLESIKEKSTPPTLSVRLGKSRKEIPYTSLPMVGNALGKTIKIENLPKNWYFLRILISTSSLAVVDTQPQYDVFGNLLDTKEAQSTETIVMVEIDYRNVIYTESGKTNK